MDFSVYMFTSQRKHTISYDRNLFAHDARNVFFLVLGLPCFLVVR